METSIIVLSILAVILIGVLFMLKKSNSASVAIAKFRHDKSRKRHEIVIPLEPLPADTQIDTSKLIEITDKKLISRIAHIVPNMLPVLTSAGTASTLSKVASLAKQGDLFRVILPQGGELVKSKSMPGAFRGVAWVNDKLHGGTNLVKETIDVSNVEVAANVASSVFSVASLVVGLYYMDQIDSRLGAISDQLSQIADFQNNEYKSKIITLARDIRRIAGFQAEILENADLRDKELIGLQASERECVQLLEQANQTIIDITQKHKISYDEYEKQSIYSSEWSQYQQTLVEILYRIGELKYTLNLGSASKKYCFSSYDQCSGPVENISNELSEWHRNQAANLAIDLQARRRKRQGVQAVPFKLPGMINDDLNYVTLNERIVELIQNQTSESIIGYETNGDPNLFGNDVELIVKDGKLFYLPSL